MGDEAEEETDHTDIEHQRIEQQEVKRAGAGDRDFAEPEMQQWQYDAQNCDDDADHDGSPPALLAPPDPAPF